MGIASPSCYNGGSSVPKWRNGRRAGLKNRWELIPCQFESDLRHQFHNAAGEPTQNCANGAADASNFPEMWHKSTVRFLIRQDNAALCPMEAARGYAVTCILCGTGIAACWSPSASTFAAAAPRLPGWNPKERTHGRITIQVASRCIIPTRSRAARRHSSANTGPRPRVAVRLDA